MDAIPIEWVNKLFNCLELFYGERFKKQFCKSIPLDLYKTIWQSGLVGCSHEEIKSALVILKRMAESKYRECPNHLEFYRIAKKLPITRPRPQDTKNLKTIYPRSNHVDAMRKRWIYRDALR